jgi:hypothetical protein
MMRKSSQISLTKPIAICKGYFCAVPKFSGSSSPRMILAGMHGVLIG